MVAVGRWLEARNARQEHAMSRVTAKFKVQTEDGDLIEILEYTKFLPGDDDSEEIPGPKFLKTNSGIAVDKVGENEFEIERFPSPIRARRV